MPPGYVLGISKREYYRLSVREKWKLMIGSPTCITIFTIALFILVIII